MLVHVGMPQMAVRGLSENWLFKFCGDRHWHELSRLFGTRSQDFVSEEGERIYSSFVAIRGRYAIPLSKIEENTEITFSIEMDHFGMSLLRSRQTGMIDGAPALQMEMLTKFVAREKAGSNALVRSSMRPVPVLPISEMQTPPKLLRDFQQVRSEKPYVLEADGRGVSGKIRTEATLPYLPNPYTDYNGAGLLYFASFPSICDCMERRAIRQDFGSDWSLVSGTIKRDIFYFGNLDLGDAIEVQISKADLLGGEPDLAGFDTTMREDATKRLLARVFTLKALGNA